MNPCDHGLAAGREKQCIYSWLSGAVTWQMENRYRGLQRPYYYDNRIQKFISFFMRSLLRTVPLLSALLLSATASNAQTAELDEMHQKARSFCIQNTDLCLFIQRRAAIVDMCGEVALEFYDIRDLNAFIKRGLLNETYGNQYRLASESAAHWCGTMGVKGLVIERN